MYKKIIFIITMILLINGFVFSLENNNSKNILDEKTLLDITPGNIIINKDESICKNYEFVLNDVNIKSKSFLQLLIANYIPISGDVSINVELNGFLEKTITNKDIVEKNIIELTNINNSVNNLSICVINNFLPRIVISQNSVIGNYYVGEINENDFYQIAPEKGYLKELIPITIYIKNSGYADLDIEVINATDLFIYNSNLENVSGETSYTGILKAQGQIELNYFVKTDKNISFATPYAKVKYIDIFGREQVLSVKNSFIEIIEKENYIESHIDVSKKIILNKNNIGNLIIKNNSEETLEDVYINPFFTGEIKLSKNKIEKILPKDVIEIPFVIKNNKEGILNLNFNIDYFVNGDYKSTGSNVTQINFVKEEVADNKAISILIIITIILFIWIVKI